MATRNTHDKQLRDNLEQIINIAQVTLKQLGGHAIAQRKYSPKGQSKNEKAKTLRDYITDLRDKGFFKQPKTAPEVHKKIELVYACEQNRVSMALLRAQRDKKLRKSSKVVDGKKLTAYVW